MEWSPSFIASTACLIAFSSLLLSLFKHFFWEPASLSHSLLRGGLVVLPYSPIVGSVSHLKRVRDAAASLVLPSPSDHHIAPLVLPFYTRISLQAGLPFVYWWGTQPRLVISDPDDIKQILSSRFKDYKRSDITYKFLSRLLGKGLLTSEGQDWHNQRSILRHAFFPEKLNGMVDAMSKCAMEMVKTWEKAVEEEGGQAEVEVAHHIKDTMADIIARTSFGSSYEKGKAVFERQAQLVELIMQDLVLNSTIPGYKYIPTWINIQCWRLEKSIEKELVEIVEERRRVARSSSAAVGGGNGVYGEDLLGLMLSSEEQVEARRMMLTTRQVVDECKTFFFAGHETTSHLLAWTMVMLGHYVDWQERARQEVLQELAALPPAAHHLPKLKILNTILYETLRLYPPVPELGPRVEASSDYKSLDLKSMKGMQVPKGMSFSIPLLLLHRDKELWGDDADEFRPERFNEGITKACKHPCAFLPFSFGPRTCIGQNFALMEAKVVLATLLQHFRFRLSPNYMHAPFTAITVRPRYGVPIILDSINSTVG
ncbi:hypothetical protein GOP47_0004347 [Adiantum capillus-veneris]|uniref:Cytochrome P450 n=1 Tax=Adiantum capillus-veneris TaxID=13818 RepID=A0A9D4V7D8_ADICA|nr:hypothetical protein GOP47_0004347 [Adiantum capillus-veneris]